MKFILITSILFLSFAIWSRNYIRGPYCEIVNYDLKGKTIIVTGSNTGIGLHTAKHLALMGAEVILACRTLDNANKAKQWIIKEANTQKLDLVPMEVDLSKFSSVKEFIKQIKQKYTKLDVLVNNAGVMRVLGEKRLTSDGLEEMMQVNHFSHFLLTTELLELLKKSKTPRIINVSSLTHKWLIPSQFFDLNAEQNYDHSKQYGKTKMANVLFSLELQKRVNGTNVCVSSLHPGVITTDLVRDLDHLSWFKNSLRLITSYFFKTTEQGASTQIRLASDPSLQSTCGKYWADCSVAQELDFAKDEENAKRLWEMSEEIIEKLVK